MNPLIPRLRAATAWALYWAGDAIYRMFDSGRGGNMLTYRAYSQLMSWSDDVQGDGPGPWKPESIHD